MKMYLYSIKDVLNGFAAPVIMPNHDSAKRWFLDMCKENPTIKNNKNDFSVHFVGTLDTDSGTITPAKKKNLERGLFENEEVKEDDDVY